MKGGRFMYINIRLNDIVEHSPSDKNLTINCVGYAVEVDHNPSLERQFGLPDYQLIYIESGCGYFKFEEDYEKVSGKAVVIYKPNEPQIYKYYEKDSPKTFWIHFSGTDVEKILKELDIYDKRVIPIKSGLFLKECIERIIEEYQNKPTSFENAANNYARLAIIELKRELENASKKTSDLTIERLCREMNMNFHKNISNAEYANMCNMSVPHFLSKFKSVTGTTPQNYILNLRISNAKNLLVTTDYKIMEISQLIGLSDSMYFCKRFKRLVGITPTEYRQKFQI